MPTYLITNNTAAQNGVTPDTIYLGCYGTRLLEDLPGVSQFGAMGVGNGAGVHNNSVFYAYALDALPANGVVSVARLHVKTEAGFGSPLVNAHQLSVEVEVTNATYNERKPGISWVVAGASADVVTPAMDSQMVSAGGTWHTFDVTQYAQDVISGNAHLGMALIAQNPGGDDGFWSLSGADPLVTDGDRWQLEVVMTGGTPGGNLPTQDAAIDFTGANGSQPPAPLVPRSGTFAINNNAMVATGSPPVDTIGWFIGAETYSPNGIVSGTYNANGGDGGTCGLMIRYVDNFNFWDVINGNGSLQLVLIRGGSIQYATPGYAIPGYDASTDFEVSVLLQGDQIIVSVNGSEAINVVDSSLNRGTIHGAKYAGTVASIDNLVLPALFIEPSITQAQIFSIAENSITAFGPVLHAGEGDSAPTGFTISGSEFTIDANGNITPVTGIDYGVSQSFVLAVTVTDQYGTSDPENITINIADVDESMLPTVQPVTASFSAAAATNVDGGVIGSLVATNADEVFIDGANASAFRVNGTDIELTGVQVIGSYSATIRVVNNDPDSGSVFSQQATAAISLTITDSVPVITPGQIFSVSENSVASVGTVAYTGEGDSTPTGFTISGPDFIISNAGVITPSTGVDYGAGSSYVVVVTVTDQYGTSVSENITINITDADESVLPTVQPVSVIITDADAANVDGGVIGSLVATNADEVFIEGANASAFRINGTNIELTGTQAIGSYSATIRVVNNDPDAGSVLSQEASAVLSLTVEELQVFVNNPARDQTAPAGSAWALSLAATVFSETPDSIVASLNNGGSLPAGMSFDGSNFSWPNPAEGTYVIRLAAVFNGQAEAYDYFTLAVEGLQVFVNNPVRDQSAPADSAWALSLAATVFSEAPDSIVASLNNGGSLPAGMSFDGSNFSWPNPAEGTYVIRLAAVFNGQTEAYDYFALTVSAEQSLVNTLVTNSNGVPWASTAIEYVVRDGFGGNLIASGSSSSDTAGNVSLTVAWPAGQQVWLALRRVSDNEGDLSRVGTVAQ